MVAVSADGKKVDPQHHKLFRDDVLILVSPELATPPLACGPGNGNIQLQFQIQPGQILPALPLGRKGGVFGPQPLVPDRNTVANTARVIEIVLARC